MKEHLTKLFNYNGWANSKLADTMKNQNIIDKTVLRLFSHVVLSEQIWMLRMENDDYANKNFWQILTLSECENIIKENQLKYKSLIDEKNFLDNITYKNSKGIEYTNSIFDILIHVSTHSAYHRGQIAKEIRKLGKEPVLTDYIAYIREKKI